MRIISFRNTLHTIQACIHCWIYICDICFKVSFIVDQSCIIKRPDSRCRCIKVCSCWRFISKWPHNNRWMVSVFLYHPAASVTICILPTFFLIQPFIFFNPFKSMRLQIRFINYIETISVAQIVEVWCLRIVWTANCIDVILLHQNQILFHYSRINGCSTLRTEIMHIHTIYQNYFSVNPEVFSIIFNLPETNLCFDHINRLLSFKKCNFNAVQIRFFCIPTLYFSNQICGFPTTIFQTDLTSRDLFGVLPKLPYRSVRSYICTNRLLQNSVFISLIKIRIYNIIVDCLLWFCINCHISENPWIPPHILAFQVGSIWPAVNSYRNLILPGLTVICDIEFASKSAYFTVSNVHSIDPYIISTAYSIKTKNDLFILPSFFYLKASSVNSCRIFWWYKRWINWKQIPYICIVKFSVSIPFPASRYFYFIPALISIILFFKMFRRILRCF